MYYYTMELTTSILPTLLFSTTALVLDLLPLQYIVHSPNYHNRCLIQHNTVSGNSHTGNKGEILLDFIEEGHSVPAFIKIEFLLKLH